MTTMLTQLEVRNYRSLAKVIMHPSKVSVFFGPNGVGKSSLLDTIWFLRDCAIRGVEQASSSRSHGVGMMWIGAEGDSNISIALSTETSRYQVQFGFSSGRIEPFVGEKLVSLKSNRTLIDRKIGSDKAEFFHLNLQQMAMVSLREPEKLALTRYVDFESNVPEANDMDRLLRFVHLYKAREADLFSLKQRGSETSYQTWVWERGHNLWSVLRNLKDRRGLDDRFDTIMEYMRKSFPSDFSDLFLEQTGPTSVYASFQEKGLQSPIAASGVSDGHLQMLLNLTCLFAEGKDRASILMFDEPEISLHPLPLAIFAEAAHLAANEWNKQVFIATHSPVLMSQFEPNEVFGMEKRRNRSTAMQRVSDMENVKDLLEEYALGSLYMAEAIAPQSENPQPFSEKQ